MYQIVSSFVSICQIVSIYEIVLLFNNHITDCFIPIYPEYVRHEHSMYGHKPRNKLFVKFPLNGVSFCLFFNFRETRN